ncbi:bactofilin family protein [Vulgatibacter incomptus]|uniref:Integral membrane protein CcmA involved in cell shape determination n=1 Tax=Vulgatibacter incomptus TaxID=1391653 RepID=A0A0K1PBH9_9BACT|nr:polymer-forming cytoskeletal protein [Vulgatibacter incomptus]AKU90880.1 hypothetical protein AKJ08_1267 [Vulgatibacter incomptus]
MSAQEQRIPRGLRVRGTIEGVGDLVVLGTFEGTIALEGTLQVEEGGRVDAEVRVTRAIVCGSLKGPVVASESIELRAGCTVEGDLRAPRLDIAPGSTVRGRVELGAAQDGADSSVDDVLPDGSSQLLEIATGAGPDVFFAATHWSEGDGPPPMPASALSIGDRRKAIVPGP